MQDLDSSDKLREQPEQENQQPKRVTQKPEMGTDGHVQGAEQPRAGEEGWSSSHRGT